MEVDAFCPTGATVSINPGTGAQSLNLITTYPGGAGKQLVTNASNQMVFMVFGGAAATTAAGMPLAAGATRLIECGPAVTSVSVIVGSAATGNVYFTPGRGGV